MRTLKTPEEIIQDHTGIKPGAKPLTPMDYGECVNVIIAAQRDALECAAENATLTPPMENKTDKPYSLQDAKDEVAKKNGYISWEKWRAINFGVIALDHGDYPMVAVAELYASKATEELRKEMDGLIEIHHLQTQELVSEIERLKESNKELVEALNMSNQLNHALVGIGYIEWVECEVITKVIQKSEGEIKK